MTKGFQRPLLPYSKTSRDPGPETAKPCGPTYSDIHPLLHRSNQTQASSNLVVGVVVLVGDVHADTVAVEALGVAERVAAVIT